MKTTEGIHLARRLKTTLQQKGVPLRNVYLFGSVARGVATERSDIDIAVVCEPYRESKHEENVEFLLASKDVDLRIETVCLHPEDFENKYFTLAQEVRRYGIPV